MVNRGSGISDGRAREIEEALPSTRATLSVRHAYQDFSGFIRLNRYGSAFENIFNDETLPVTTRQTSALEPPVSWARFIQSIILKKSRRGG